MHCNAKPAISDLNTKMDAIRLFFLTFSKTKLWVILLLLSSSTTTFYRPCNGREHHHKPKATAAFFIFGDSTVDPGNNNYITSNPENRANYKPYGQNGFFAQPTGRFSDGRISVDFIAEKANLPLIPPFMQPFVDRSYGVNFASGGAGILPDTNQGNVIDFPTQLKNFEVVRKSLAAKLGYAESERTLSEAVYFVSIGSNDYLGGYLGSSKMQAIYPPQAYIEIVVGNLTRSIQFLYEKGARKFGFISLIPLGCLPALRAINPMPTANGSCFEQANTLAKAHNLAISNVLQNLRRSLKGFKYSNTQSYEWFKDRIDHPTKHGFKEGVNACCGTGKYRGTNTCGGTKSIKQYDVCDKSDEYVFWDSYHASEKIHEQLANDLWDGPDSFVGPYKLKDLFLP